MIRLSDRLACTHLSPSLPLSRLGENSMAAIYTNPGQTSAVVGERECRELPIARLIRRANLSDLSFFLLLSLFCFFFSFLPAVPCVRAGARVSPFSNPPDRIVPFAPSSGSTATLPAIRHSISNFALAIRAIPRSFSTGSHTVGVPSFPAFLNPFPLSLCLSSSFFTRNPHSSSLEYPRKAPRGAHPQASSLAQTSVQIRAS